MPLPLCRTLALALLLILLPLCLGLALLLIAVHGRPVLFRQQRTGLGRAPFEMIKFRTMTMACDPAGNLLPDAQRVGRLGRILRRSRLDELPELLNIVRGEMTFVGPRPLLPETVAALGEPGQVRSSVLPGLTGWAQVSGNTLLSNREKVALDLWYVAHRSLALDLKILVRTPAVLLFGEKRHSRRLAAVSDRVALSTSRGLRGD